MHKVDCFGVFHLQILLSGYVYNGVLEVKAMALGDGLKALAVYAVSLQVLAYQVHGCVLPLLAVAIGVRSAELGSVRHRQSDGVIGVAIVASEPTGCEDVNHIVLIDIAGRPNASALLELVTAEIAL
jgi:hypothetical protein